MTPAPNPCQRPTAPESGLEAIKTWNPATGCGQTIISPGCELCYARRLVQKYLQYNEKTHYAKIAWRPCIKAWELEKPKLSKHGQVFVGNMTDLLGLQDFYREGFFMSSPDNWRPMTSADAEMAIKRVLKIIASRPYQEFLILTKRAKRLQFYDFSPANLWTGVSICNQNETWKLSHLLNSNARNRWLSIEPMLSSITFDPIELAWINWVVVGGESGGMAARKMEMDWVTGLYEQCQALGIPFFFKQVGDWYLYHDMPFEHPIRLVRDLPVESARLI